MNYNIIILFVYIVTIQKIYTQDNTNNESLLSNSISGNSSNAVLQNEFIFNCGTPETDYAPCINKDYADSLFKQCCLQHAPEGCQNLCQYETDELKARNLLLQSIKSEKCKLEHMSTVLYCASQNQNNQDCCKYLNLADEKLGVGDRCLQFCNPANGISSVDRLDVTCLYNWNVLMYCHHSGIKLE